MNLGNNYAFKKIANLSSEETFYNVATKKGVGIKTTIMLGVVFITALAIIFNIQTIAFKFGALAIFAYLGMTLVNFVLQLIIAFVPKTAKTLSIPYAISEGALMGALVGILEIAFPSDGIKLSALALVITIGLFFASSILYTTGIIKVTEKFRAIMFVALIGVMLSSIVISVISIFASNFVYALFYENTIGIIISVVLVIFASIYAVISLDNAEKIVESGADKKYEWFAAFGITINVVWLFLEVLRLILIIYQRNK